MQGRLNTGQQVILLALFFLLTFLLRPEGIVVVDHQDFMNWTTGLVTQGLDTAFTIDRFNYGPGSAYFFYLFGKFFGARLHEYHILMRQALFLFDLAAIFILMRYLDRSGRNAILAFFVLFNPAFLYNSLIWGQMDGMATALVFAAVVAGLIGQPELASVMFVLAFSVKPQPIALLPVVGLLWIPAFVRRPSRIVTTVLAAAGAQLILLIPFLQNGAWQEWIASYVHNTRLFPFASMNAYNLWYLVLTGDPTQISDATTFLQLTFKMWGVGLFACFSVIALLPLAGRVVARAINRQSFTAGDGMLAFLVAGMMSVGLFFFNAEMHERYAFPAILFLGAFAIMARDYFLYILVSVAHLLNINAKFSLSGLPVPLIQRLSSPEIVALLFLVALILGLVKLYRMGTLSEDVPVILNLARNWRARNALAPVTTQ